MVPAIDRLRHAAAASIALAIFVLIVVVIVVIIIVIIIVVVVPIVFVLILVFVLFFLVVVIVLLGLSPAFRFFGTFQVHFVPGFYVDLLDVAVEIFDLHGLRVLIHRQDSE
ncbi:MAG TPA: hypothetical protein VGM84_11010 [Steroidobacteraceae bacterium]